MGKGTQGPGSVGRRSFEVKGIIKGFTVGTAPPFWGAASSCDRHFLPLFDLSIHVNRDAFSGLEQEYSRKLPQNLLATPGVEA